MWGAKRWQAVAIIVLLWAAFVLGCHGLTNRLVLDGYDGKSFAAVNARIENHRHVRELNGRDTSREWYKSWAATYAWRGGALGSFGFGGLILWAAIPNANKRVRRFLFAPTWPVNLAILRIALFAALFAELWVTPIREFAAWHHASYKWPALGGALLRQLPISVELVDGLLPIALMTSVMAMLGLFTRTSAIVSCLLAFYLLGIPQCSGKVNHGHHVLLIGCLLALSRSGDALSLDAFRNAIRRADMGIVRPIGRSVRYGVPIRLSMLVMATCYFFPGFWKIAANGPAWVFSDNLQNQMYKSWFELEYFDPPLPLHLIPGFMVMGALTTIIFEIGFPFAILWRPTRLLWAGLGLLFHNMTRMMMNISFYSLQVMYVMFVDWQRLFSWIGRRAGEPLFVLYDGNCRLCRRTIAIMVGADHFRTLRPVNVLDDYELKQAAKWDIDTDTLLRDMHVVTANSEGGWRIEKGFAAYRLMAWRIPLLWPALPLLYLSPVAAAGATIYRHIADRRQCQRPKRPERAAGELFSLPSAHWSARPLVGFAVVAIGLQVIFGMARIGDAWPVACYPTFETLAASTIRWPEFEAVTAEGAVVRLDDDPIRQTFSESRYVRSMQIFANRGAREDQMRQMLGEFVKVWEEAGLFSDRLPHQVLVYVATYELSGTRRPTAPLERELLATFSGESLSE